MKRTVMVLLICMLGARGIAQEYPSLFTHKVEIGQGNHKLSDYLRMLEQQVPGLVFVYSPGVININRLVVTSAQKTSLYDALAKVFDVELFEFQQLGQKLVIKKREPPKKRENVGINARSTPGRRLESNRSQVPVQKNVLTDSLASDREVLRDSAKIEVTQLLPGDSVKPRLFEQGQRNEVKEEVSTTQVGTKQYSAIQLAFPRAYVSRIPYLRITNTSPVLTPLYRPVAMNVKPPKQARPKKVRVKQPKPEFEKKFRFSATSFTGYTELDGEDAILMGGRLTYYITPSFGIGLAGNAFQTSTRVDQILNGNFRPAGGYGGVLLEYTLMPWKKLHLNFPLMIGGGGIAYLERNPLTTLPTIETSLALFVIEQGVELEINLLKFLRVGAGLSYRYVSNTSLNYQSSGDQITSNQALTGLSFGITVKGGIF